MGIHYNDGMLALRYVYVLALVVWLGGMVVLGAVVAPTTFQVLQASEPATGRALAGERVRRHARALSLRRLRRGRLLLLVTLAAMAVLGPRPRNFARARSSLVAAMLAVALYSGFVVLGGIEQIQQEVGTPAVAPARQPTAAGASASTSCTSSRRA